jgi:soluble lytic murein transglycosylase
MRAAASLLIGFCLVMASPPALDSDEGETGAVFARAYALYTQGQHAHAKELFRRSLSEKSVFADYSLFYLADIARAEQAWDDVRRFASRLKREYPQSLWIHAAELQIAKADLAENRISEAVATLRALRLRPAAPTEILEEASFLAAQAAGDSKQAYELYQQLREQYPTSKWTPAARRQQRALRESQPDVFPFPTTATLMAEADQLVRERAFNEAETLFKKLLNQADDPDLRLSLLNKLSGLYLANRRRNEAMPILEQTVRDFPETPEAAKALFQIGQILWNRHENAQALATFQQLMTRYPSSPDLDRAVYAAADIQEWSGNKNEAIAFYHRIRTEFPRSSVRDDATWRLAWLHYRGGELPEAYRFFKILSTEARESGLRTAAYYWQARAAEKAGDGELAKRIYGEVYQTAEESYYQALASGALARLSAPVSDGALEPLPRRRDAEAPALPGVAYHLVRARGLARLEFYGLAAAELAAIEKIAPTDEKTRLFLTREYFSTRAYRQSLALATQLPASEPERNLYRFPLAHWETIQKKAQELKLDPYLVVALIRQESLFEVRARSPASALGLMQLLPSTAARVARRTGMPAPSDDKLYDPEVNLTLGTQYLKDLLQRYSDNWFKAIAAYNAGEAAVDRWENEIATDDHEEFVERIPYLETRNYVKLVLRNHRIYKRLYEQKK